MTRSTSQTPPPTPLTPSELPAVLLTGFEPFGGESENPSELIVRQLEGRVLEGHLIRTAILPCEFGRSIRVLQKALRETSPRLVLCIGQAGGRADLTLERVAINVDDASIPDNAGQRPIDQPVCKQGPAAYWTTLPIKAMTAAMQRTGLPASVSQTAGTFVCNHVFYGLMKALKRRPQTRGGFLHVPFLPSQAQKHGPHVPFLQLHQMAQGVRVAIETALRLEQDEALAGGSTH